MHMGGASTSPPSSQQITSPTAQRQSWHLRFRLVEWIVTVLCFAVAACVGTFAIPLCRPFSWSDATIHQPYHENTFPSWSLIPISVLPVIFYILFGKLAPQGGPNFAWDEILANVLMQGQSITFSHLMTDPIKIYAGRFRPDFLSRLEMGGYSAANGTAVDYCSLSDSSKLFRDGRLSFPSGHSSTSFSAIVPLCLFLFYRLNTTRQASFLKTMVVVALPLSLPIVVAVSRTIDNRHNYGDVFAGAFIGIASGFMAFHLNQTKSKLLLQFLPNQQQPSHHHTDDSRSCQQQHNHQQHLLSTRTPSPPSYSSSSPLQQHSSFLTAATSSGSVVEYLKGLVLLNETIGEYTPKVVVEQMVWMSLFASPPFTVPSGGVPHVASAISMTPIRHEDVP